MSLFLNKVAGLHTELFLKKGSCTRIILQDLPSISEFCKKGLQNTSGWLLLQNILLLSTIPLISFFTFYFKYFQSKYFSILNDMLLLLINMAYTNFFTSGQTT